MGNCITAPFRRNYQNRSGTRAAGRGAAGGGARVGADGSTGGPGLGWRGAGRARIDGHDASAWAARGRQEEPDRQLIPTAMGGAADGGVRGRDAGGEARRV